MTKSDGYTLAYYNTELTSAIKVVNPEAYSCVAPVLLAKC